MKTQISPGISLQYVIKSTSLVLQSVMCMDFPWEFLAIFCKMEASMKIKCLRKYEVTDLTEHVNMHWPSHLIKSMQILELDQRFLYTKQSVPTG